jgi:hypothetical protein
MNLGTGRPAAGHGRVHGDHGQRLHRIPVMMAGIGLPCS